MSKKKLDVDNITNELAGASLFFKPASTSPTPPLSPRPDPYPEPAITPAPQPDTKLLTQTVNAPPAPPSQVADDNKPTGTYNEPSGKHASKQASMLSHKNHDLVKTIRKTVNRVGKETLYIRLTPEEKHALESIVYSFNELYRGEGRKTSENEIGRIGLNNLLEDYQINGANSLLAQVLASLLA